MSESDDSHDVRRIDLHAHSNVSDGTDSPTELVLAAAQAGLDVVALTDHDTSGGWSEAAAALPIGMTLVPGAELSCNSPDGRGGHCSVHLLAYLYDPDTPELVEEQARLRAQRRTRLQLMAQRMATDGFPIDAAELMDQLPADSAAGRPHLARALLQAGVVSSVSDAFDRYLRQGKQYYLPKVDTPIDRAIKVIDQAGGVTVLAHPFAYRRGPTVTASVIAELADQGLVGVEVAHSEQDQETQSELRALAKHLGLLATGGSDYHGSNKTVRLGQETTAPTVFAALVARADTDRLVIGTKR